MIEIRNLQKESREGARLQLEHFRVCAREVSAIVGPPGSGIQLLFDLLTGNMHPAAGTVRLNNLDPAADWPRLSRSTGILFEEDSLYTTRTVRGNLTFQASLFGLSTDLIHAVLDAVGLADQAGTRVEALSSGQARRLAFARAVLHDPSLLILVEPFTRCDQDSIVLLKRQLRERAEKGNTVLILAADDGNLAGLCERIYRLENGQIAETREPSSDPERLFKIPVKGEGSVTLVHPGDILFADADEGRAALHTSDGERLVTQFTLSELEKRLSSRGFFRAHRGYLVNLQHVAEVIPFTRNSFNLRLDDEAGSLIPLSKTAAAELRDLLGY
ncbi:MAG: LytTR family transcriptional regulator DNA-binding domain-containing protein [Anaerolineales bacterium]|nr:LytTR family transcriptional regulator DNA-binding domain-containing protein [Anaerolineales bacterium]